MPEREPHQFVFKYVPNERYFFIIYCEKCGQIAFYGNSSKNDEYQKAITHSCGEKR